MKKFRFFLFHFVLIPFVHLSSFESLRTINRTCACGVVYLTVSAEHQFLVVNWRFKCKKHPDQVKVFEKVTVRRVFDLLYTVDVKQNEKIGHVTTDIRFDFDSYPGNWNPLSQKPITSIRCFPFYVTAVRDNEMMCWSCLDIHPKWMSRFPNLRLGQMMIPGTFRSGAIEVITSSGEVYQNFDIWGQLVSGIRYFDLLVGLNQNSNNYRDSTSRLYSQLDLVAEFIKKSKKEVVILDIRDFSRNSLGPKLSKLWTVNKRILINYRYKEIALQHKWLWYEIFIKNGRSHSPEELKEYMFKDIRNHRHEELFCNFIAAINDENVGRTYYSIYDDKPEDTVYDKEADSVNPYLHDWIIEGKMLNEISIIGVPFFEGTRIVDDAINSNKIKNRALSYHVDVYE